MTDHPEYLALVENLTEFDPLAYAVIADWCLDHSLDDLAAAWRELAREKAFPHDYGTRLGVFMHGWWVSTGNPGWHVFSVQPHEAPGRLRALMPPGVETSGVHRIYETRVEALAHMADAVARDLVYAASR